jgi:hypothetical protein
MPTKQSKAIVVDADVARSAGENKDTYNPLDPCSRKCREFLETMIAVCHQLVMTDEILDEWKENALKSRFSSKWLRWMFSKKKVVRLEIVPELAVEGKILNTALSQKAKDAIEKDLLLIRAALNSDRTIASRDEEARKGFRNAAGTVSVLGEVAWVNPQLEDETLLEWLKKGAPHEAHRLLKPLP